MSDDNTPDDYEIGYGKPPKNSQFKKGTSGNPEGRPKKARDFGSELLREAESLMTVQENGQSKRITKNEVVIKQLIKQAMTGNIRATRTYFDHYLPARDLQLAAELKLAASKQLTAADLSDDQLERIIFEGLQEQKRKSEEGNVSNT